MRFALSEVAYAGDQQFMSEDTSKNLCMVSVIMPTNNRKYWAAEALESVFAQTYSDYEVIVVDDGSEDGTSEYLQERFGDRIKLFRTGGTNSPTARNFGAAKAQGKYLAFLDDDDRWYPAKLERQVDVLEASSDAVGMVGSACDHMDEHGNPIGKPSYPHAFLTYEMACIKPKLPGAITGTLIKRFVYDELGGFDVELTRNQDRDLWIRLTRKYQVPMLQDILSTVRLHGRPRRGVSTDVIETCRLQINSRIPERKLRKQADAWTYFHLFGLNWKENKAKALRLLMLSFISYPLPLPLKENRLKKTIQTITGI